jgi:prolyl-tRNA synthetase
MEKGISGANKTDYHTVNVAPGRDFPLEGENIQVIDIRNAVQGDTYQGKELLFKRGIEVGQVFKLGTKYSEKLGAKFLDVDGKENPCLMGCYGIGINRIMASAIELCNDKHGIIWPISIAPWQVIITLAGNDENIIEAGEKIYSQLLEKNIEVIIDDRDVRGGVKFKDADLIGIPVRITIGKKSIAEGKVEIKLRRESENKKVDVENCADQTAAIIDSLKEELNVGNK